MDSTLIMGVVVLLALLFEFTNGWNDAANAIATVVSTKVLKPRTAVLLSAAFNIVGAFLSVEVAATVSKMINASMISPSTIAAAMISGALWNYVMTRIGMPISASHALLGSVTGAAVAAAGAGALKWDAIMLAVHGLWSSPLIGLVAAVGIGLPIMKLAPKLRLPLASLLVIGLAYSYKPLFGALAVVFILGLYAYMKYKQNTEENEYWKKYQLISTTLMSLAHGTNDAQKVMGVITMALIAGQFLPDGAAPPSWVKIACAVVMGLGTYLGGWEVIKTLGEKLTDLKPVHGFVAETAAAAVLSGAAGMGVPVSTTHTITGAIMGVGVAKAEVNWKVASKIGLAWVFTIPVTFAVGFFLGKGVEAVGLWSIVAIGAVGVGAVEFYLRRRKAVQLSVATSK